MKLKFYYENLKDINEWIKAADNKANFLVAFYSVLIGSLLVQMKNYIEIIKNCNCSVLFILISCFLLLSFFFIGKSFWHFYCVVHPRIAPRKYIKDKPKSNIFWGDIASVEFNEFKSKIQNQEINNLFSDILSQLYINSKICDEKFKNVKSAYRLILPTLISLIIYTVTLKIGG
ncbi:MAG: hypothetical protein HWN66_20350 [Candidatus Helarchaeota archaeon]|nr:hypothetical protein [Candidatus Helarchaeota archaeon]